MSSPAEDKHLPADGLTAVTKGAARGHSESERGEALWSPALPDACPRAQSLLNIPLPPAPHKEGHRGLRLPGVGSTAPPGGGRKDPQIGEPRSPGWGRGRRWPDIPLAAELSQGSRLWPPWRGCLGATGLGRGGASRHRLELAPTETSEVGA